MTIENKIDHHSCTKKTAMRANINIILHSWQAQKLFHGSWKHGQFGLVQFAKIINPIFSAHDQDDPYAEYYILKISSLIFETQAKFRVMEELLSEKLNAVRGRTIELFTNEHFDSHTKFCQPPNPCGR